MRIVHVADYVMPRMGYQEFLLAKWNARHGHDVHIITSDRYTPVPDYDVSWKPVLGNRFIGEGEESIDGVTIHRLKCRLEIRRRIWLKGLKSKIAEIRPDVVFCHGTSSPLAFILPGICRNLHIPLVLDNHMAYVARRGGIAGALYYRMLRLATRKFLMPGVRLFLGVTAESCDFLVTEQGVPRSRIEQLDLGVDTELFRPDREARASLRAKLGIPAGAPVVMQSGKLSDDKRPDWLAAACAPIMKSNPDVRLVFLGGATPASKARILAPVLSLGLQGRVLFLPMVEASELGAYYNLADMCVYPAASSLSCIEAAACAVPVIVTDLPIGLERERRGAVISYRTGNVQDLRKKIEGILQRSDRDEGLGVKARDAVLAHYSYDSVALRLEVMMKALLSDFSGPGSRVSNAVATI